MQKYIAFNLYRRNELGGCQQANDAQRGVYLASDVEALRQALSLAVELFQDECDPVSEPDSYAWLQTAQSLMAG